MKNWIKLFLPLAIVLAGIAVGQQLWQNKQNKQSISGYRQTVSVIPEKEIDQVLIVDQKGSLAFINQGNIWKLAEMKADDEKIKSIISIILDSDGSNYDLISQNPNKFNDFKVSSDSAKIILKKGDSEKLNVVIGSNSYPGNFIRLNKENNVYLTTKSLGEISTGDRQNYLDKSVYSGRRDNLKRISIAIEKEKYILTKVDGKWRMENSSQTIDESKLNELLGNLENLKADKVLENSSEENDYKQNYGSLVLETSDGKGETIEVFQGKSGFMLSRKSDGQHFTSPQATIDGVLKTPKNLLK